MSTLRVISYGESGKSMFAGLVVVVLTVLLVGCVICRARELWPYDDRSTPHPHRPPHRTYHVFLPSRPPPLIPSREYTIDKVIVVYLTSDDLEPAFHLTR